MKNHYIELEDYFKNTLKIIKCHSLKEQKDLIDFFKQHLLNVANEYENNNKQFTRLQSIVK